MLNIIFAFIKFYTKDKRDQMHAIILIVFFSAGASVGFLTPGFVRSIARSKCGKHETVPIRENRYASPLLRPTLCIVNALVWVSAAYQMEHPAAALLFSVLFSTALLIALIDFWIRIIPNELVLALLIVGSAFQALRFGFLALLGSAACLAAMLFLFALVAGIMGFGKVGAGDVKLAGAMGLALGYPGVLSALIMMSAALIICSLIGLLSGKLTMQTMLPLAPFMMLGMSVSLLRELLPAGLPFFAG